MVAFDVNLQIERNGGCAIWQSSRTVGFSSDQINGDGEVYFANKVSQKDKCAGGNADKYGWRGMAQKVGRYLCGKFGDSARDLVVGPEDSLNVGMHGHGHTEKRKASKGLTNREEQDYNKHTLNII